MRAKNDILVPNIFSSLRKMRSTLSEAAFHTGIWFLLTPATDLYTKNWAERAISEWARQMATQIKDLGCGGSDRLRCLYPEKRLSFFSFIGLEGVTDPPPPAQLPLRNNKLFNTSLWAVASQKTTALPWPKDSSDISHRRKWTNHTIQLNFDYLGRLL